MNDSIHRILEMRAALSHYVSPVSYATVSNYIEGFNAALGGSALFGFNEWLATKRGLGTNLHWSALILNEVGARASDSLTPSQNDAALEALFSRLAQFEADVRTQKALVEVFARFADLQGGRRRSRPGRATTGASRTRRQNRRGVGDQWIVKALDRKLVARLWGRSLGRVGARLRVEIPGLIERLRAGVASADPVAMTCLAYLIHVRLAHEHYEGEELALVRRAALMHEPAAQLRYSRLLAVSRRMKESILWLRRSAENGLTEGMFRYAVFLLSEHRQPARAADLLVRAHRRGDRRAAAWLAHCHERFLRSPARRAAFWTQIAASNGDARCMHNLGIAFETGDGVRRNLTLARRWYRMAARRGVKASARRLRRILRVERADH